MKRSLGQNFLINKNVAMREVSYAKISKNDVVLEVGPGKGILTELLAKKAKKVLAIEIDEKLIKNLKNKLPNNVELIHNDILKVDLNKIPKFNKIVANLPFQISSPVTFKFLDFSFSLAVLVFQKEFANRMIAISGSKDYSRLSVGVYYKAKCELLETIPKTCFKPQPKVDSCMIRLTKRKNYPFYIIDEKFFFNLIKNLFNHRRKKIKYVITNLYDIERNDIPFLDKRAEELNPEQLGKLSNIMFNIVSLK